MSFSVPAPERSGAKLVRNFSSSFSASVMRAGASSPSVSASGASGASGVTMGGTMSVSDTSLRCI